MMKKFFGMLTFGALTVVAQDYPPGIPEGQVTYDDVIFQEGDSELPPEFISGDPMVIHSDSKNGTSLSPVSPSPSSNRNTSIEMLVYALDYQVRGMGVTNGLSKYGYSAFGVSHTMPNRNIFHRGIQQRVHGMVGVIWDASCPLGDTPQFRVGYAIGKEVLPNLLMEVGYNFRYGGLEGYMAKNFDRASHRSEQDVAFTITYNDHQKGFFFHLECGLAFYGLTGTYFDGELGYRFTDVSRLANGAMDLEVSVGAAPSLSYWGSGVEGVDACRIKIAALPYSYKGTYGRDAHLQVKPWVQCSWSCNNASKIARHTNFGPVDHFQVTFGLDLGWNF